MFEPDTIGTSNLSLLTIRENYWPLLNPKGVKAPTFSGTHVLRGDKIGNFSATLWKRRMELSFGWCMFSLLKFGGIGLFTCKMLLHTYYMQPIEPNECNHSIWYIRKHEILAA